MPGERERERKRERENDRCLSPQVAEAQDDRQQSHDLFGNRWTFTAKSWKWGERHLVTSLGLAASSDDVGAHDQRNETEDASDDFGDEAINFEWIGGPRRSLAG